MAEGEDKSSKKHEASAHKKKEAKKKGNVSKSQDVGIAVGLIAGFGAMIAMKKYFMSHFLDTFAYCERAIREVQQLPDDRIGPYCGHLLMFVLEQVAFLSLPVLVSVMVFNVIAQYAMVGIVFTGEQLKPKIEKINPMKGIKRWFSIKSLVELGKSLAKVVVTFALGWMVWKAAFHTIADSVFLAPEDLIGTAGKIVSTMFYRVALLYAIIAMIDFMFQKWQWKRDLKMSDKEMKDEYKQQEGDPYMKGKRRQMAYQIAMNSSAEHVPQADAVVINPTELAIALKYDPEVSPVPWVIAKGDLRLADEIRESALKHGVPVVRNKPLARALFELCEIGDVVPADLFRPIAEVLAYVFALQESGPEAAAVAAHEAGTAAAAAAAASPSTAAPGAIHELGHVAVPELPAAGAVAQSATAAGWSAAPPAPAAAAAASASARRGVTSVQPVGAVGAVQGAYRSPYATQATGEGQLPPAHAWRSDVTSGDAR
jgi:flagellar biosynthesis protein FlhB